MKKIIALLLVLILSMSVVACSKSTNKNDTNENKKVTDTTKNETKVTTTEKKEEEKEENKSHKIVAYMPSPVKLDEALINDFKEKTGIDVELFQGKTGEILARLEAEKDNPIADIVMLASWSDGLALKDNGMLESYNTENSKKLHDGFIDNDHTLFGVSASAIGVIYNTTLIENMDADWNELASEQYKDQLIFPDPEKSGSAKDFLAGYMYSTKEDWSAFESMANNGMKIIGANKASLESVLTGENSILVGAVDYNAFKKIKAGEPIKIYYPKSGTVVNPRPAMILKTSKNMEDAKTFIDYLLSDDAQKIIADAYLIPGNKEIEASNRTNMKDIPTFKLDWIWMKEHASSIAKKLNDLTK